MVSYLQFGNLRLSHFLPDTELAALDDWEYENQLRQGIRVDETKSIFDEPYNAVSFVKDRKSYEFKTQGSETYILSCTVLSDGTLTYLSVRLPLPESVEEDV